jgi:hypothetical protein
VFGSSKTTPDFGETEFQILSREIQRGSHIRGGRPGPTRGMCQVWGVPQHRWQNLPDVTFRGCIKRGGDHGMDPESQITAGENTTNRHVKYSGEVRCGPGARDPQRHVGQIRGVPQHHGQNAPDGYYWDPFAQQKWPQIADLVKTLSCAQMVRRCRSDGRIRQDAPGPVDAQTFTFP